MMDTPDYFDADHIGHDEGNLLSGIDNKTIRRQEISICLPMFLSQLNIVYKEINWVKIIVFELNRTM